MSGHFSLQELSAVDLSSAITDDTITETLHFFEQEHPRLFLALAHHRTTRNTPLDFVDRPWLHDIFLDNSPEIIIQKASQISISETMLCELLAQAKQGRAVMYVMPTDAIIYDFTPRRIDRLIDRVPYYRAHCGQSRKASDTKRQKTLFGIDCNFCGTNSVLNFYEKPCDVLIIDEYDKCDQNNIRFAYDRLESAKSNIVRIIGNPTESGKLINAKFMESTAQEWFVRCEHCGEKQELDWFNNVVRRIDERRYELRDAKSDEPTTVCVKCEKRINRLAVGEWVAAHPDNIPSGYHCSSIFGNPRSDTIKRLFNLFVDGLGNPTIMQQFYNNRLGLPYNAEGTKIDEELLRACVVGGYVMPHTSSQGAICGVDIGNQLHVTISDSYTVNDVVRDRYLFIGSLVSYEDLAAVCARYNVVCGVMDAGPEIHEPRKFVRSAPGAWYLCRYNLNDKVKQGAKCNYQNMIVDHASRSASVNRTESLDETLSNYIGGLMILPSDYATIDGGQFVRQMSMPTRIKEERPDGTFRYIWTKGEDHYRHSDNYRHIAKKIRGGHSLVL